MPSCFHHCRLTTLPGIAASQTHAHWHICKQGMHSPLLGECLSAQVIYSCVLSTHPHAIKMLVGCALLTHQQFILPSSPPFFSFTFPCILFTRGRLFSSRHTWHPPFCLGSRGEAHKWLLSPVIPFSFQHQFSLWCDDCADNMRAIAEGGICSPGTLFIFPLSICTCNDFYGLSVTLWWLGVTWSILVFAIHPPDGTFPNPL